MVVILLYSLDRSAKLLVFVVVVLKLKYGLLRVFVKLLLRFRFFLSL